ncbi:TetR family transcriptional regulator [Lachnoclostridium sp. An181]|uniref:TetR family transcriptional regulator n=1 Tax=Lachnoclostridium sp. An181 TaxID=1965575 RepID=UPI000B37A9FB|nr:TetR family transcriptional regulator [Lachnoclostridium sp. An181]OUP48788.1 TetR family transcriptional regulator [Lachnoclostridium sp. An181]
MPKGSEELTNARKKEIVSACASLYETMGFKDITIRDIGAKTSFTRTSIYNYFQTKEEIFLALLKEEHEAWSEDMEELTLQNVSLTVEEFADRMARILEKRKCMLKLMSMNIYDMEVNSRLENLVDFKKAYANALQVVSCCLEKFFPNMNEDNIQEFVYAFFPFLFGVYPYTSHTDKQLEAMKLANINYPGYSIYEITRSFIAKMMKPFEQ